MRCCVGSGRLRIWARNRCCSPAVVYPSNPTSLPPWRVCFLGKARRQTCPPPIFGVLPSESQPSVNGSGSESKFRPMAGASMGEGIHHWRCHRCPAAPPSGARLLQCLVVQLLMPPITRGCCCCLGTRRHSLPLPLPLLPPAGCAQGGRAGCRARGCPSPHAPAHAPEQRGAEGTEATLCRQRQR